MPGILNAFAIIERQMLLSRALIHRCASVYYSVYLLYEYKNTHTDADAAVARAHPKLSTRPREAGYSVYLLYWYKSTHTDADEQTGLRLTGATYLRSTRTAWCTRRYSFYLLY